MLSRRGKAAEEELRDVARGVPRMEPLVDELEKEAGRGWTVAWVLWGGMFAAVEGAALLNKRRGDTLSEHVWGWFSVKEKGWGWRARRFGLLAGLAWLVAHFLTGGKY